MNKQQLASKIWESANSMRGKIEANEYKDYILGFIFYKFLSDKEVEYLKRNDWTDADFPDNLVEEDDETVRMCQNNIGFFISYKNLFSTWIRPDNTDFDSSTVYDALSAFNRLIGDSYRKVFTNIFDTLQTGLSKLGDTGPARTKAIRDLLDIIKDIPMDGKQDYDVLGYIYEYLIGNFAANAGKKAGEFYTPHEVALIMANIVAYHHRDRERLSIYDPTSGSASLLINIGKAVERHSGKKNNIIYYAQELIATTYNLTRMNLVMRGIIPGNIVTRNADTLERDWPFIDEDNNYTPLYVDAVVSNPPYSQKWDPSDKASDARFESYGLAPKGKADYAFLLHNLYHTNDNGIMTIVLPHGVLFRGGEEGEIRKRLIENNKIDAIIGLPANIFFGTGIPTIIMVLKKNRADSDVLIIDASKGFVKDGKQNKLRACDIKRVTDTYISREDVEKFSRKVSKEEIVANDYNLNIPRYVDSSEKPESFDIYATMFGGIPEKEIDELSEYWNAFPSLKDQLFARKEDGYFTLKSDDLSSLIEANVDVTAMQKDYAERFKDLGDWLKTRLIDGISEVALNKEEDIIGDELFRRLEGVPLIDRYDAYQLLDEEWTKISGDIEIIKEEGFDAARTVDPKMVVTKKDGKTVEKQDGWNGRILPFELIQERMLSKELNELRTYENRLQEINAECQEIIDLLDEERKDRLLNDDNDEFSSKSVDTALKDVLEDISNDEIETLQKYLCISKKKDKLDFINSHSDINWSFIEKGRDGTYSKSAINKRISEIRGTSEFEEGSYEWEVSKASRLIAEEKAVKNNIKTKSKLLEDLTKATIEHLSDEEIYILLYQKWIIPLLNAIEDFPSIQVKTLYDKVSHIGRKYKLTYQDVENQILLTSSELSSMINDLTGNDYDMTGLKEFQKILEG